jgi:gamma-glutamylputrescine oxidase
VDQSPPVARPKTYYTSSLHIDPPFPALEGRVEADVAIIGGGFTGVASAVELAQRGLKVALLESRHIGWGASGRNGGQVTGSLSGDTAMRKQLCRTLGSEADDFIWALRWRGQKIIEERVARYGIHCDLKHGHLQAAMKPAHVSQLRAMYDEACARGMAADVELLDRNAVRALIATDRYVGGLRNRLNLHLHPLNLCIGEACAAKSLGAMIFERSAVMRIVHGARPAVLTAGGRVDAQHVILAGDVYHRLEPRRLGGAIFPAIGGIVTSEPLGERAFDLNPEDLAVYDCRFVLDYHRLTADRRLLFGGGAHYSGRESRDVVAELRPSIERTFPALRGVRFDFAWTCAMGIVINRIPQVGWISPNVWYCQGYSGHGIATSHVLAEILCEALTGTLGRFDVLSRCKAIRIPYGQALGNPLLTVGMLYYQLLEWLR